MRKLQNLVEGYLKSIGFNLLDTREGFVVADRLEVGGDRDTRVLWIPHLPYKGPNPEQFEMRLLHEIETTLPEYPNARYFLIAYHLEGLSKEFKAEAKILNIKIRTAFHFFDARFRMDPEEESEEARRAAAHAASAISQLRDSEATRKRVRQPYSIMINGEFQEQKDDLLLHLSKEIIGKEKKEDPRGSRNPCVWIVVGAAGAGKSVLFEALFSELYDYFLDQKNRRIIFPRPIPLIPAYFREVHSLRIDPLIDNFIRTEVAIPVPLKTFKWMLINNFVIWFFDGLDELYAGYPDFFTEILDFLTNPESQAEIIIYARESLLKTSENFAQFIREYSLGNKNAEVRVYKLNDWGYASKRDFAWLGLKGELPKKADVKSTRVSKFITAINKSKSLKTLSGLPYYCELLLEEYKQKKTLTDFANDFTLIDQAIKGIIKREIVNKKLLSLEQFENNGLDEWLETLALECYYEDFKGIEKTDLEEYARYVLSPQLSKEEYKKALSNMVQFPLFAPGIKLGLITFKHELIAGYLAGRYLMKRIFQNPIYVGKSLGSRIDFADSLIARYMANAIAGTKEGIHKIYTILKTQKPPGNSFANILQLLLLSTPVKKVIQNEKIELEGRDLRNVKFEYKYLKDVSLRDCDLSNVTFKNCDLENANFDGAILSGTRFENLEVSALKGAQFGNLERFDFIYVNKKRIDDLKKMIKWLRKTTGLAKKIEEPCPAALQLKSIFLKFVYPNGNARRNEIREDVLTRGKKFPSGPNPEECVRACIRFGYFRGPDYRKRITRTFGDKYSEIVRFIKDGELNTSLKQLINSLCKDRGCEHIPGSC